VAAHKIYHVARSMLQGRRGGGEVKGGTSGRLGDLVGRRGRAFNGAIKNSYVHFELFTSRWAKSI